jgi:hypothetical protein
LKYEVDPFRNKEATEKKTIFLRQILRSRGDNSGARVMNLIT